MRSAYNYLRERLPGTAIMLYCCGAPSRLTGEEAWFQRIVADIAQKLEQLGSPEVLAACTHCLEVFKDHLPQVKSRSLYEVLAEIAATN